MTGWTTKDLAARGLLALTVGASLLGAPAATAAPHGCISMSNNYSINHDLARRSVVARVNNNQPCQFFFSPGDTFTGSGEYKIECETGGAIIDPYGQGLQTQVPIPQPCDPGALVTVHAGHLGSGGGVIAGSPL